MKREEVDEKTVYSFTCPKCHEISEGTETYCEHDDSIFCEQCGEEIMLEDD